MEHERIVFLGIAGDKLQMLYPLLETGVGIEARAGVSLGDFLLQDAGLDPEFVAGRVQTVFCDCSPVDDVQNSRVHDGCVVALSAAMPGLVGAVMRKGGPLSRLRESISEKGGACEDTPEEGAVVWLKIFNLLRQELAAQLLGKGVLLPMRKAAELLRELPADFWEGSDGVMVKGRRLDPRTHELGLPETEALVMLEVRGKKQAEQT